MVPHRGTSWAALWLTVQIERDVVLSESYGCGWYRIRGSAYKSFLNVCSANDGHSSVLACIAFNSKVSGPRVQDPAALLSEVAGLLGCYLHRHPEPWFTINQRAFDSDIVLSITFMSLSPRL
jgi:hypothetical protein